MLNIYKIISDGISGLLTKAFQTKRQHIDVPVGAGYYALRHNTSRAGIKYTKLVKKDNSRQLDREEVQALNLKPQTWRDL